MQEIEEYFLKYLVCIFAPDKSIAESLNAVRQNTLKEIKKSLNQLDSINKKYEYIQKVTKTIDQKIPRVSLDVAFDLLRDDRFVNNNIAFLSLTEVPVEGIAVFSKT
jgi:Zn-dependent M16 (insulinase) family peptidase